MIRPDDYVHRHSHLQEYCQAFVQQDALSPGSASQLAPGIFQLRSPLQDAVASELQEELQHFEAECQRLGQQAVAPSVLRQQGAVLAEMGLQRLVHGFVVEALSPLVETLFPETGGLRGDEVFGMIVHYGASKAHEVEAHLDNSCITLDICLGSENFDGGDLVFTDFAEELAVQQKMGHAVLFAGHLTHYCRPTTRGNRANLVLWCMSKAKLAAPGVVQRYSNYLALAASNSCTGFDVPTDYLRDGRCPVVDRRKRHASASEAAAAAAVPTMLASRSSASKDHACSLPQKALRTSRPDAVLGLDCVRTHLESCLAMDPQRHVNNLRSAIHLHRVSRVCADAYGKMTHKASRCLGSCSTSKEIITMQLGGCGAQLGAELWSLFSAEHGLNSKGQVTCEQSEVDDRSLGVCFGEMWRGRWRPRSIFADARPGALDDLRTLRFATLAPADIVTPPASDSDSVLMESISDAVRHHAECCDRLQGFALLHGAGGQSALLANSLEHLSSFYGSKSRLAFSVLPTACEGFRASKNAALAISALMSDADAAVLVERQKLWDLCRDVNMPLGMLGWNRGGCEIMAQALSSLTGNVRFGGAGVNEDLQSIIRNHVPMPGLHFLTTAVSPVRLLASSTPDITGITTAAVESLLSGKSCEGKYMSCSMSFRGEVLPKDVMAAIVRVKTMRSVQFVDWSPLGFKCAIEYRMPVVAPGSLLCNDERRVGLLACHTSLGNTLKELSSTLEKQHKDVSFPAHDCIHDLQEGLASVWKNYEEAASEDQDPGAEESDDY